MSTFKRTKVVMLPTKEKVTENISIIKRLKPTVGGNELIGSLHYTKQSLFSFNYFEPQHLYFLSDDEIKEGDLFLYAGYLVTQCIKKRDVLQNDKSYKKIIATTDKSLTVTVSIQDDVNALSYQTDKQLPEPSQGFIQKYCEKGGIDEVMVEYEFRHDGSVPFPKVASDNTITIRPIKDSWSREEVEYLCRSALHTRFSGGMCFQEDADKWIKENL